MGRAGLFLCVGAMALLVSGCSARATGGSGGGQTDGAALAPASGVLQRVVSFAPAAASFAQVGSGNSGIGTLLPGVSKSGPIAPGKSKSGPIAPGISKSGPIAPGIGR
jgi:hypothetical protein